MKRLRFFFLAQLLFLHVAFGQSNFLPGSIVQWNGDTVKGFIDYRNNQKNSQYIKFKRTLQDTTVRYLPGQIKAFDTEEKNTFLSYTVYHKKDGLNIKKHSFLEVLEAGRANLLYQKEATGAEHLYISKDSLGLEELINTEVEVSTNESKYIASNKEYLRTLMKYMYDGIAQSQIQSLRLSEKEIARVIRIYNAKFTSHLSDSLKPKKVKQKIKVQITGLAGYGKTFLTKNGQYADNYLVGPVPIYGVSAGVAFNLKFPRMNRNLSLQLELNYNKKGAEGQANNFFGEHVLDQSFDLNFLDAGAMLKYTMPKGAIRPFLGGGIVFGYLLGGDNSYSQTVANPQGTNPPTYKEKIFGGTFNANLAPLVEYGFSAETGIFVPFKNDAKGLVFLVRYEYTILPANLINPFYFCNAFYLKAGYRFK